MTVWWKSWAFAFSNRQYNWMAIPPPPEDSNNLSTPLERLLAMEQQKRLREQEKQERTTSVITSNEKTGRPRESPSRDPRPVPSLQVEPPGGERSNQAPGAEGGDGAGVDKS